MPAVVADTQLLSSQVTIAVIRAATVVLAVWNVAGFSLPVAVTLTVNPTRGRVGRAAPPMTGAIVGARVYPEKDTVGDDVRKDLLRGRREVIWNLTQQNKKQREQRVKCINKYTLLKKKHQKGTLK